MSTKLTTTGLREVMPEPLTVLLDAASQSVLRTLTTRLRARGYEAVTEPHLILFGNLDCGATHAAHIAQRMRVSRQAISKTLQELQRLDFLRLEDDPDRRNQKLVVMRERGMRLALEARDELHRIEAELSDRIGADVMEALRGALEKGWGTGSSQTGTADIHEPTRMGRTGKKPRPNDQRRPAAT